MGWRPRALVPPVVDLAARPRGTIMMPWLPPTLGDDSTVRKMGCPPHSRLIAPHWSGTQLRNLSHPGLRPGFCSLGTTEELGKPPQRLTDVLPSGRFDDHRGDG